MSWILNTILGAFYQTCTDLVQYPWQDILFKNSCPTKEKPSCPSKSMNLQNILIKVMNWYEQEWCNSVPVHTWWVVTYSEKVQSGALMISVLEFLALNFQLYQKGPQFSSCDIQCKAITKSICSCLSTASMTKLHGHIGQWSMMRR